MGLHEICLDSIYIDYKLNDNLTEALMVGNTITNCDWILYVSNKNLIISRTRTVAISTLERDV